MPKYGNFENWPYINQPKLYTGTYDLLMFDVIVGSFGTLVSKWDVTCKQVSIEKGLVNIGTEGSR